MIDMKKCKGECGKKKELSEFCEKNRGGKVYYENKCKQCSAEYAREYRKNNKEKVAAIARKSRKKNEGKIKERNALKRVENKELIDKERRSLSGKLISIFYHQVSTQKRRSERSGKEYRVLFTRDEFIAWAVVHCDYIQLHKEWVESGYKKELSPSFDRKDDYEDYSFENFNKWMTWGENNKKYNQSIKNGDNVKNCKAVKGTNVKTGEVFHFHSISNSIRFLFDGEKKDVSGSISACCKGNRKVAYGYTWEYSDINGDKQHD